MGELALAEWRVALVLVERPDALLQCQQRRVDFSTLHPALGNQPRLVSMIEHTNRSISNLKMKLHQITSHHITSH